MKAINAMIFIGSVLSTLPTKFNLILHIDLSIITTYIIYSQRSAYQFFLWAKNLLRPLNDI
jgi:hypothetical protein